MKPLTSCLVPSDDSDQLAFVNDQDAPEPKDGTSTELTSITGYSLDRVETSMIMSRDQSPERTKSTTNQDATIPWWHREPGASSLFRGDGGSTRKERHIDVNGGDYCGESDGDGLDDGRHTMVSACGRNNDVRSERDLLAQDAPNFRASSVLVRLPGMAPPPPPPPASGSPFRPFHSMDMSSMLRSAPSQRAGANAVHPRVVVGRGGDAARRAVSPVTISYTATRCPPPHGYGAGRPAASHYLPMASPYPNEQITELTALNDILFGPEGEDPHLFAAAQARAMAAATAAERDGEDPQLFATAQARAVAAAAAAVVDREPYYHRPKAATLASLDASHSRAIDAQRYDGYGCDDEGHENGRLPSIAGLVAAGAFIRNDKWRSFRPPGSLRVREHASEV